MSDAASPPPVLGPRPFHVTDTDQRGVVMSVSILFIIYALMVLGMRLAAKSRSMGIDDWLSVGATALALPQFISVIVAVSDGFGAPYTRLTSSHKDTIASALRASDIFLLLSLFVAKCSVIWLCRRLFAVGQRGRHLMCEIAIGICAVWCLGSILAVSVGCSGLSIIRAGETTCPGLVTRWSVVGAFDAITEIMIYGLSIAVVFPLQMSWSRKFQASACFVLRLPIIVFIILNVVYLSDFTSARNASVSLTKPILFRQAELVFSLLSASIPTLNQYLRKFNTQQATQFGYNPSQYAAGSGARSYNMKSINNKSRRHDNEKTWTGSRNGDKADDVLGKSTSSNFNPPSHQHYNATVEGQQTGRHDEISNVSGEDGSIGRHNSDEYIIRKDVRYEVRHED